MQYSTVNNIKNENTKRSKTQLKPLKICLIGAALDTGNLGVSALAASLITIIRTVNPDSEISFFLGRRSSEPYSIEMSKRKLKLKVINFRLSPKASYKEHILVILALAIFYRILPFSHIKHWLLNCNERLKAISEVDIFGDIRGGDSFSDIYGIRKLVFGSLPFLICHLLKKSIILLPQTYGPYDSYLSRIIAKYTFKRASLILSRDKSSIAVVKGLLRSKVEKKDIYFCPDVAFCLEPKEASLKSIEPSPQKVNKKILGFNISGLLYNGGYTKKNMFGLEFNYKNFAENLTKRLLMETDASILLVPHTFTEKGNIESDCEACDNIYRMMTKHYSGRMHKVTCICDQSEIKHIIGLCDFFIGSRMQACIGAISQGIPTVGIAYSKKFLGVFNSIGVDQMVIDARNTNEKMAIDRIIQLLNDHTLEKDLIEKRIKYAQTLLLKKFRDQFS